VAALKLYFVLIYEDSLVEVSVHRDLAALHDIWQQANHGNCVGVIHVGFIRPRIKNPEALMQHRGKVLTTVAAKWALPEEYQSSIAVVAEMKLATQVVPLHQLIRGLGCDAAEPNAGFQASNTHVVVESERSITDAALRVLNDSAGPLNKEEIVARIVDQGLYQFDAESPLSVLVIELDRHTQDKGHSSTISNPMFQKTDNGRYYSLEKDVSEASGWVKQLADDHPDLAVKAGAYGIYGEEGYEQLADSLPLRLRDQLDLFRFSSFVRGIDTKDPVSLIKILPHSLLGANVASIDLPVRILNVFKRYDVATLADLRSLSIEAMLKWENFGRKSLGDFCTVVIAAVTKLYDQVDWDEPAVSASEPLVSEDDVEHNDETYKVELVSTIPLKSHFEKMLAGLKGSHRQIIECRTGYNGTVMTLEVVGELIGVTRERVRQIQKKCVTKVIETEFWDDCITLKVGQLLIDRSAPLYIEMLELEDPWFEGFMGNYQHLGAVIELFSENEIRVINIDGAHVVSRIKLDAWDKCVGSFRKSLKDKAKEGGWTRRDIGSTFDAGLSNIGAQELAPLMWSKFEDSLQFEDETAEAKLLAFGISAESIVQAVLQQAEGPLHYSEVALRATELLSRPVDERRALNALMSQGAKLYGRGIYGLAKFNPVSPRMCKNIQLVVEKMMYDGPLMKQWHATEMLTKLQVKFSALPEGLDSYVLNIILQSSDKLTYLNRMVWVRSDSNQSANDRVDMADAFTKILEDNGAPLRGKELKARLAVIRGVSKNHQLHPTERMIQVGPDRWGLMERDVGGTYDDNHAKLDVLFQELKKSQRGIHVSEISQFVEISDVADNLPSAYALLNLAQREDRFHLGRSMFLGLAEWNGDTRRLNVSQAVRELLAEMIKPMTIAEIHARVEDMTGIPINGTVTGVLIDEGAVYDKELRHWGKISKID
jgi:hypothetical protein